MAYGTLATDTIQSSTAGTPTQFKDGNGTQVGTLCRAWCAFNGASSASIRASFNVSSVVYNGTGDYTVNFTNAMADVNYGVAMGTGQWRIIGPTDTTTTYISTAFIRVSSLYPSNAVAGDSAWNTVAIFR